MLMTNNEAVNLDDVLPISLIRQHTKTDDDISVTDELLILYRKASIEAAEAYTGRSWSQVKTISEEILFPFHRSNYQRQLIIILKEPVYDGIITISGGNLSSPKRLNVMKGARRIIVPFPSDEFEKSYCYTCTPQEHSAAIAPNGIDASSVLYINNDDCSCNQHEPANLIATYRSGVSCNAEIPNGIIVGCLKYIAWQIGNPGDQLVTMADIPNKTTKYIKGTNNAVLASGAAEQWCIYRSR